MNHIELFAGCGGLSLGLETAGFSLLTANELSPMASETFAFNHLNADLKNKKNINKVFWVSSSHSRSNFSTRLRENPNNAIGLTKSHYSDLLEMKPTNEELKRSLMVGSIADINNILDPTTEVGKKNKWLLKQLKSGLGGKGVDLVSGGPPCQSFSLAGMRDHSHQRNQLPGEFAKFVGLVKPRIALLENVSGILSAFTIDGSKHFAWFEVAKAFAKEGYIPLCLKVNAKYVGAAQNRPRFLLIALREDVYKQFKKTCEKDDILIHALVEPANLTKVMKKIKVIEEKFANKKISEIDMKSSINKIRPKFGCLKYFDIDKDDALFRNTILRPLVSQKVQKNIKNGLFSVKDAIDDLRADNVPESLYVKKINNSFINQYKRPLDKLSNHELRQNKNLVRARFRLYQVLNKISKEESREVLICLKNDKTYQLLKSTLASLGKYWFLSLDGEKISNPSANQLLELLSALHTKKHTQRALIAEHPAPAALSIPDDACHYYESLSTQRTLSVREMARIQSFPDWFIVRSKITTGGKMRRFEVPQYTQIGNAVPPLLGLAAGKICRNILDK